MIKRRTADQNRVRQPGVLTFTILMGLHICSSFRVSPTVSDVSCFRAHIHCCGDRFCPPLKNPPFTPNFCIDLDKPTQTPLERTSNILLSTVRKPRSDNLCTFISSWSQCNLRLPARCKAPREPYTSGVFLAQGATQ